MAKKVAQPKTPTESLEMCLQRVQSELKEVNLRRFRNDEVVRAGIQQMRATTAELLSALKTA